MKDKTVNLKLVYFEIVDTSRITLGWRLGNMLNHILGRRKWLCLQQLCR